MKTRKLIKFRKVRQKAVWNTGYTWNGRKDGFVFVLALSRHEGNTYFASVNHTKKDIRFNSLWSGITFTNIQDGFDWCNDFESKNFSCLGKDINNQPNVRNRKQLNNDPAAFKNA